MSIMRDKIVTEEILNYHRKDLNNGFVLLIQPFPHRKAENFFNE